MKSTFKVLFYLKRNAPKKDGRVPVMCRVTMDGSIAQFSCKIDVDVELWDSTSGRAIGKSTTAKVENSARVDLVCQCEVDPEWTS